ncbi:MULTISPECIES: alpha/beta fold hydrolase [unclassified Novosphingobium]|uniref:alpha/beta fold hydrolase n=1 Tax=unclassified Novosphingobium TaxID=2644732 RepID=UPI00086BAFBD|nr:MULTISPECIES: alpha/beta fold hydrolase [unclassified Novosphingobium]MBN9144906.1 alpha/beta fold hydrolase [Novosphingobium sp.]ODU82529.1 MAG: hydrolase [Novosphingobium sp. SCN 63-17]OJX92389.1 MAG: alpha/beta hydrolase [Novosphingobium sp. 63-713]
MPETVTTSYFRGWAGTRLALHRMGPASGGSGRPMLLFHGLFSSAAINWVKYGHAERLAQAGFEVIMPDLRAHGMSEAPHDATAYPEDVLVTDALMLVRELGFEPGGFDLGGFSLGSRTATRAVLAGLEPRRLVLAGMGLEGLAGWARRSAFFLDAIARYGTIKHGDPAYVAQQFMKAQKVDLRAAELLLQSVDDTPPSDLAGITMPTLVVCGAIDQDNGSAPRLAQTLPNARYAEIPGTHMSSVTQKELGQQMVEFLTS